jgi:hypothetical protein
MVAAAGNGGGGNGGGGNGGNGGEPPGHTGGGGNPHGGGSSGADGGSGSGMAAPAMEGADSVLHRQRRSPHLRERSHLRIRFQTAHVARASESTLS